MCCIVFFFFFQAEDGIRDIGVTGVQTCALPVAGAKRFLVEMSSEGFTLGTAGAVLMLALATSAFRETTDEDWLKKTELSVTFLDRYGARIGDRGTRINDTVPLEEFP